MPEHRGLLGERAFRQRGLVSERELESWLSWARVAGLLFAMLELTSSSQHFPPGYAAAAWAVTGVLAVGTVLAVRARTQRVARARPGARPDGARLRRGDRRRLLDDLLLRVRKPGALGADPRRDRGRASLRAARRHPHAAAAHPVPVLRRVVAVALLRAAELHGRPRDLPRRRAHPRRARRRLARPPPRDTRPGWGWCGPARRRRFATSSAATSTRSRRRTAAPARSARRWRSRTRSARSSSSCADSSRSTGRRSCSSRTTPRRRSRPPAAARASCSRPGASARSKAPCSSGCSTATPSCDATSPTRSTRRTGCSSRSACAASSSLRCPSARGRSAC